METKTPTEHQKNLLKGIAENFGSKNPKSMGELMIQAGYSESTSKTPSRIVGTQAMQEYIKALGIDKNTRLKRIGKIFSEHADPRIVLEANKELSKMLGDYAPTELNLKAIQEGERKEVFE